MSQREKERERERDIERGCERPNVPAAVAAGAGVNHQGAEESRVRGVQRLCRGRGGQPGGMERRPEENTHPICDFCVGEEE